MRETPTVIAATLAVLLLGGCSDPTPPESGVLTSAQPAITIESPTSTALSPTTAAPTTVPVTTLVEIARPVVNVPLGRPAVIDGVLDGGEWDDALALIMSDGATVRFLYSGKALYVAVAGGEIGAVNVVLGTDDTILILHSSAALGSAVYEPAPETWVLAHGFSWCCRDGNDDAARLDLLAQESWQANIGYTGDPGVVEYEITVPWHGAAMAVSSIRDENDTGFWPPSLSSSAREQLLGAPPDTRSYDTAGWYVIERASE